MASIFYEVRRIPDLTLSKYSALDEGGVEGVLNKHEAFLRQVHRKGLLNKEVIRWIYEYNPTAPKGSRMRIILKFECATISNYMQNFIASSPLAPYFDLVQVFPEEELKPLTGSESEIEREKRKNVTLQLNQELYRYQASLIKKEKFARPDNPDMSDFYSVNKWEINEDARLFSMFTMMKKMAESRNPPEETDKWRCLYCVDVVPIDYTDSIESPNMLGSIMQGLRRMLSLRVEKSNNTTSFQKDESADYTLDRYKDLVKNIAANPHFNVNIKAYAQNAEYANMLLDAAAAEALSEGSYDVVVETGMFNIGDITSTQLRLLCSKNAPKELRFWPTLFFLKELVPFTALPTLYSGESIEMPKETAPNYEKNGLYLGTDSDGYQVYFPLKNLSKHAFLAGVPGSGKTNSMLHLATTLYSEFGVPFLILEPAKQEYRALVNKPEMKGLTVFSPSSGTKFPLHINPFQFPLKMSLAEHLRRLITVFEGAFFLEAPMPFLLDGAIEDVYRDKGWLPYTLNTGELEYPTMSELYRKLEEKLERTEYSDEIKSNLKSALQVRIGNLITREMGDVFDVTESSLSPEEWLSRPVVIELEAMGGGPANFLTLMLATLIRETLKVNPMKKEEVKDKPRHVIFFEEAHNLIGPQAEESGGERANPKTAATAFIVKMLAEVRALNEAIIIADQLPTAMAPEVIKNTSLKLGHRMTSQDERQYLGSTMSADEVQLERMATFTQGKTLAIYEGLLKPFELQMEQWSKVKGIVYDELYDSPSDKTLYAKLSYENSPFSKDMERSYIITTIKIDLQWNDILKQAIFLDRRMDDLVKWFLEAEETRIKYENFDWGKLGEKKRDETLAIVQEQFEEFEERKLSAEDEFHDICDGMENIIFSLSSYKKQNLHFENEIKLSISQKFVEYRNFVLMAKDKCGFERSEEQKERRTSILKQWE
jgi:DNA polymerase III delta prime subunit